MNTSGIRRARTAGATKLPEPTSKLPEKERARFRGGDLTAACPCPTTEISLALFNKRPATRLGVEESTRSR